MILRDQLYRISDKILDGDAYLYKIELNPQHFIYKAHFPNEPITPGVCIVQIAKELLEDIMNEKLEIKAIKNVKFISIISPDSDKIVNYKIDKVSCADEGNIKMQSLVYNDGVVFSKLSLICSKAEE